MLGAAGEQGTEYFMLMPNMNEEKFAALVQRFGEIVLQQQVCKETFGIL